MKVTTNNIPGGYKNMLHDRIEIQVDNYTATLTTYILSNSQEIDVDRKRPMVVICPGGAYYGVSDREAEPVAIQMNVMGYHACVLKYSTHPATFPTALVQLAKSLVFIRQHGEEWNIDTNKIILAGFSAGGHLVTSLGTFWQEEFLSEYVKKPKELYQPNGIILSYPVISSGEYGHKDSFIGLLGERHGELIEKVSLEKQVTTHMPPVFIWHTFEDDVVPVENALLLANALREKNIPFELHIYPRGGHGLSLAKEETMRKRDQFGIQEECQGWINMAGTWIKNLS